MQIRCPPNRAYRSHLGFLDTLVGAAGALANAKRGTNGGMSPTALPGLPGGAPSSTTVSPTIQTQVSPQISPVFQQTGSGSQSASTTMVSPGGQTAVPAPTSPSPPGSTYGAPSPNVYNDPYSRQFDINRYVPRGSSASEQMTAMKGQQWLWPAALVTVAVIGAFALTPRRRAR